MDLGKIYPCVHSHQSKTAVHGRVLLLSRKDTSSRHTILEYSLFWAGNTAETELLRKKSIQTWKANLPFCLGGSLNISHEGDTPLTCRRYNSAAQHQPPSTPLLYNTPCSLCQLQIFWSTPEEQHTVKHILHTRGREIGMPTNKEKQRTTEGRIGLEKDGCVVFDRPGKYGGHQGGGIRIWEHENKGL